MQVFGFEQVVIVELETLSQCESCVRAGRLEKLESFYGLVSHDSSTLLTPFIDWSL